MSLTLGGIGERRPLMTVPRSAAPSNARSSNFTESPRTVTYGNGANSPSVKVPSVESLKIKQAAVNQANTVVGSRTLSGSLGGVAPSVLQMPKPMPSKNAPTRAAQTRASSAIQERPPTPTEESPAPSLKASVAKMLPSRTDPRSRLDRSRLAPAISLAASPKQEPPAPSEDEDDYGDDQRDAAQYREDFLLYDSESEPSPRQAAAPEKVSNQAIAEVKDTMRCLANALIEMKTALGKMQQHLSDQNKKWSETEQKLKYEIGEMTKVRDNFAAQTSSLKTDLRTLKEDIGGVAITEKFDLLDQQIGDLRDRTNQFCGTLLRDVWAYLKPPMDLFAIDRVGQSQPADTEFLAAGSQVVLMPPATKSDETGFWIRARLICRKGGNQKIYWVPLDTVPLALPPNAVHSSEKLSEEGTVECLADFHLFGASSGFDGAPPSDNQGSLEGNVEQDEEEGILVQLP